MILHGLVYVRDTFLATMASALNCWMSATALNRWHHSHTDVCVLTAPDSLSSICICMGSINQQCLHPTPELVYITFCRAEGRRDSSLLRPLLQDRDTSVSGSLGKHPLQLECN